MRVSGLDFIRYSDGIFELQECGEMLGLLDFYVLPRKLVLKITI
jgi:hypothetical protein